MLDVELPDEGSALPVVDSFRACLAAVTEYPVAQVPKSDSHLRAAVAQWRAWLAGHDLGLVPIADPSSFQWAGYWIALLETATAAQESAVLMFGSPPGVVLSPQDKALLGRAAADLPVVQGYAVAPLDPAATTRSESSRKRGRVEALATAPNAEAPMELVASVRAIPGRGLAGDRYAKRAGTFTPRKGRGSGHDLTMIEAEVLEELVLPDGSGLGSLEARRNIVTRGIDLNSLVGRVFTIGDVECVARRLCEPCAHLERLTRPGVLRGLIHTGGIRVDIVTAGVISQGMAITPAESSSRAAALAE